MREMDLISKAIEPSGLFTIRFIHDGQRVGCFRSLGELHVRRNYESKDGKAGGRRTL
jgi:hypothetical protein